MTQLSFYNSLSKQKEIFKPIEAGKVGLYSCGPTVYDRAHIGNFRSFLMADLLQRVVRHIGQLDIKWVMNITDIDDKMIRRAHERDPELDPKVALQTLAQQYEKAFLTDLVSLGVDRADIAHLPRATEHISEMQSIIRKLLAEGIAYIADGSVYFSLSRYEASGKKYGQLVNVDYDPHARIDDQDQKDGAGDFALWKAVQTDEPAWDFEIDGQNYAGRPGWHIECSAMSTKYLGQEFDLHTGGVDNKFPHHENEIAQCGGVLARYWLHGEHLQVNQAKMAKSDNNFFTLEDISRDGDPLAFRLMVLSSHYRSQMDYSAEGLAEAGRRLKSLREWASKVVSNDTHDGSETVAELRDRLDAALADDLSLPAAQAIIAEAERSGIYGPIMRDLVLHLDAVLGLRLLSPDSVVDLDRYGEILNRRAAARTDQDYATSDRLRDELLDEGIGIEDTASTQIVWRITN